MRARTAVVNALAKEGCVPTIDKLTPGNTCHNNRDKKGEGKISLDLGENRVDVRQFLWYYMSTYSYSKGEAAMVKEDVLIAIDAQAVEAARAEALPEAHLLLLVETFQALADPTRARILYALTQRPMCVRDLAILVGVSASAVSHQLRLLRDRRLVKPRREGNIIYYVVDDHHVATLFKEADYHVDHVRQGLPDHPYP
jgi:ArsR family transcriptional regulator, lead/cadmium/zinc/bismuth-responsive transcriptional repressor